MSPSIQKLWGNSMAKYSHYRYDREYKDLTADALFEVEVGVERSISSSYRLVLTKLGYMGVGFDLT